MNVAAGICAGVLVLFFYGILFWLITGDNNENDSSNI